MTINFTKVSDKELTNLYRKVKLELARRAQIYDAAKFVSNYLQNQNIDYDRDLIVELIEESISRISKSRPIKNPRKSSKESKSTRKAAVKYISIDGSQKWSGRGRSPKWVLDVCEKENISLEEFKRTRTVNE